MVRPVQLLLQQVTPAVIITPSPRWTCIRADCRLIIYDEVTNVGLRDKFL
jgi:hypothetical protein